MNGGSPEELESRLQESREDLRSLVSSRRIARIVSIVGTVCGFGVVIVYVVLFLSPIFELRRVMASGELQQMVQEQAQKMGLMEDVKRYAMDTAKELREVYQPKVLEKVKQADLQQAVLKEVRQLVAEVRPTYQDLIKAKVEEFDLDGLAQEHGTRIVKDVGPKYIKILQRKLADSELAALLMEELKATAGELGPVYSDLVREKVEEMGLRQQAREALQQVLDETVPAFRDEFDRIKPRIAQAAEDEADLLLADLRVLLKERLEQTLKDSLARQQASIGEQWGLTDAETVRLFDNVLTASKKALRNLLEARTESQKKLAYEIKGQMVDIPLAKERDLDNILDQMVKVMVMLLKYKLPEYPMSELSD